MSTTSETFIEPAVFSSVAATTGAPGFQGAAQNVLPTPKYLDPEWIKEGVPDTKFYKDYPPDAWGQEAAPNARVWKIYRDEMTAADTATLKSWNETLDVLLIFAGLFSAVSTAFIIESYKSLQPDYTQYMANFLYEAAKSSHAVNGGITLPAIGSIGPPDSFISPSATQRWTNGLWFTSLVVSLTVALLCILIKQWLDQYRGRITRSASSLQHWARRHQLYYRGLSTWGVPTLISLLPLLLHVSLFLFFTGLVLFLRPLDSVISTTLLTILVLTLLFYVLSLVVPAWCIDCPSYAPLSAQARSLITFGFRVPDYLSRLLWRLTSWYVNRRRRRSLPVGSVLDRIHRARAHACDVSYRMLVRRQQRFAPEKAVSAQRFILDGRALTTLLALTNNPDIIDAAVEAIGAISAEHTLESILCDLPIIVVHPRTLRAFQHTGASSSAFDVITNARRMRSMWSIAMTGCRLNSSCSYVKYPMKDLYPFLGLDGMMLQLMGRTLHADDRMAVAVSLRQRLFAHSLALLLQTESSGPPPSETHRQPISGLNRATCLVFLRMINENWIYLGNHRMHCILLSFFAGNFAEAESHERTLAVQIVHAALNNLCKYAKDDDVAINTLDRVFATLSTRKEFLANDKTIRVFAHHLGLLAPSIFYPIRAQWAQLSGFAAFVQLPYFQRYISRAGLEGCRTILDRVETPSCRETELFLRYWHCVAIVLKVSCDFGQPSEISQWRGASLVTRLVEVCEEPQTVVPFLDHSFDTVLLKLIQVAVVVGSRASDSASMKSLGSVLLTLLCRRQRLRFVDEGLIDCLFTGSLLTNGFLREIRDYAIMPREHILRLVTTLAKHCARLSLDNMVRICDELETPSDGRRALGEDGLALVGRLRRGLQPGGELRGECDACCVCMLRPEAQPPPEPMTRAKRWRNRILGSISAAPASPA